MGNPHVGFDVAGVGNGLLGTAPALDPTCEGQECNCDMDEILWHRGSGRQGRSPVSGSLTMSIARVGHVAIPQFVQGNRTSIAWCKRPGCLEDLFFNGRCNLEA